MHTVQIKKENTGPMLAVSEIFDYCIMSIFVVATALQSDTEPLTCLVFFLALSQKLYYIVAMSLKIVACPALLTKMLNLKAMQASTPGLLGERTIVFSVSLKGRPAAYRNFCSASWGRGRFSASRAARSVLGNDDFQKQHFIPTAANVYKNIFQLFKGTENLKNL